VEGAPGLVVTHLQGSKGVGLLLRAFYLLCEDGPFCLLIQLDNAELIHLCECVCVNGTMALVSGLQHKINTVHVYMLPHPYPH